MKQRGTQVQAASAARFTRASERGVLCLVLAVLPFAAFGRIALGRTVFGGTPLLAQMQVLLALVVFLGWLGWPARMATPCA